MVQTYGSGSEKNFCSGVELKMWKPFRSENPEKSEVVNLTEKEKFDRALLQTLGTLKMINFNHIAYIGRGLDGISDEQAYKILWCNMDARNSHKTYDYLRDLCNKGSILPWRSWPPDKILTCPPGRAKASRSGVFYVLGRNGRRLLREKFSFQPNPSEVEELYLLSVPLARYLTAASCALTLAAQGYQLLSLPQVWQEREDVPRPAFKPDAILRKSDKNYAFYIYDSPFGLRAEFFVAHVRKGLAYFPTGTMGIILVRSSEAFGRILTASQGNALGDYKRNVFVGDLAGFSKSHGHNILANAENNQIAL